MGAENVVEILKNGDGMEPLVFGVFIAAIVFYIIAVIVWKVKPAAITSVVLATGCTIAGVILHTIDWWPLIVIAVLLAVAVIFGICTGKKTVKSSQPTQQQQVKVQPQGEAQTQPQQQATKIID